MSVACTIQNPIETRWMDQNNLPHSNLCESKSMITDWTTQSTTDDIGSGWQGPATFLSLSRAYHHRLNYQILLKYVRSDHEGFTTVSPLLGAYFHPRKRFM